MWYDEHSIVMLYCPLEGSPKVTKKWYFNGKEISSNENFLIDLRQNMMLTKGLNENSQGTYVCNSSNEFGVDFLRYDVELAGF